MKLIHNILFLSGKPWAVQAAGQPFVYFNYNPVGDNIRVYSSLPNDWERNYTYDMLGRRLTYQEGELAESYSYNGGNLATHTQNWLENGIIQNKTTHYHYNAHRLDSVGYDDALTTIYHYNAAGQTDSIYDESGVVCYQYGNMGEITKETRIYALPFLLQPIALTTQFTYDSRGRIQDITYPDNEVVSYGYDLGGQLQSIANNSSYTYLDNVTYDRFGAKVSQEYGNGMITSYAYDSYTRRLSQITVTDNSSNPYSDIQYGYDLVGNVTQVTSTCPWLQNQNFMESFTYDAADQLTAATEMQNQSYQLAVTYGTWGKVNTYDLTQKDMLQNTTTQDAYTLTYPTNPNSLQQEQTMFAPAMQYGGTGGVQAATAQYTFGINGSLRKKVHFTNNNPVEYYLFNSAANLKAYSYDKTDFSYYGYNASNTRVYKLSMLNQNQWLNGHPQPLNLQLQSAMFYPNAYINFNHNGEYTKHYYNGTERIASRLGNATLNITTTANSRLTSRTTHADNRFQTDVQELMDEDIPLNNAGQAAGYTPIPLTSLAVTGTSSDIFYYHMNHLGSTAYVTDQSQNITQGFLYAPFGEITTEYAPLWQNGTLPKYAFNAKELDEETGMYYYEARYYKPPVFTSRDPMFEKYFWMTPYAYCANNPVKYVDPSGRTIDPSCQDEWNTQKTAIQNMKNTLINYRNKLNSKTSSWGQRNREIRIKELDERINSLNETLSTMSNLEEDNSTTYTLSYTNNNGSVSLIRKGDKKGMVCIKFSTTSSFVHEVTHAGQYYNNDIGFFLNSGAIAAYDIYDEVQAYKAALAYDPFAYDNIYMTMSQVTPEWVRPRSNNYTVLKGCGTTPINIFSSEETINKSGINNLGGIYKSYLSMPSTLLMYRH